VTQSNAASAEESAAAAEELNAQAEVMKQSVAELLQLMGGKSEAATNRPAVSTVASKKVHASIPTAKRPAPINGHGNGHGHTLMAAATAKNHRCEIPMDDDFKNF